MFATCRPCHHEIAVARFNVTFPGMGTQMVCVFNTAVVKSAMTLVPGWMPSEYPIQIHGSADLISKRFHVAVGVMSSLHTHSPKLSLQSIISCERQKYSTGWIP